MRLLLDSRVVDWPRSSNLIVVTLSSLKPLFFNEHRTIETHGARFWVCRATRNRPLLVHATRGRFYRYARHSNAVYQSMSNWRTTRKFLDRMEPGVPIAVSFSRVAYNLPIDP